MELQLKYLCFSSVLAILELRVTKNKTESITMDQQLELFVGEILEKKQIPGITPEVRQQLLQDLKGRLLDQINRALIAALPEDKITELDNMLDNGADEVAMQKFIVDSGVNVGQITVGAMVAFRNLYLGEKAN